MSTPRHGKTNAAAILRLWAKKVGITQAAARRQHDVLMGLIRDAVWTGRLVWPGLGVWTVKHRPARKHPAGLTPAADLPARRVVTFRAAKSWRTR